MVAFLCLAAVSWGCSQPVGTLDGDAGAGDGATGQDSAPRDALVLTDAFVEVDGGLIVAVRGWRSEAFEHSAFVPEGSADPGALDRCDPYLFAVPGGETWWVGGSGYEAMLDLVDGGPGPGGLGLVDARGILSEPGQYGHMDSYERSFDILEATLLTCPTVARLGHCVVPRAGDLCPMPEPPHDVRETHLLKTLPGPVSDREDYELRVTYDPGVADTTTTYRITFGLTVFTDPTLEWAIHGAGTMMDLQILEVHEWLMYEEIPYSADSDGWVMRHRDGGALKVSLSGVAADGSRLHVWGDFQVDETIGYP